MSLCALSHGDGDAQYKVVKTESAPDLNVNIPQETGVLLAADPLGTTTALRQGNSIATVAHIAIIHDFNLSRLFLVHTSCLRNHGECS